MNTRAIFVMLMLCMLSLVAISTCYTPSAEPVTTLFPQPARIVAADGNMNSLPVTVIELKDGTRIQREGVWGIVGDSLTVVVYYRSSGGYYSWYGLNDKGDRW